jgi:hypothetical protein
VSVSSLDEGGAKFLRIGSYKSHTAQKTAFFIDTAVKTSNLTEQESSRLEATVRGFVF